ncbi:sulfatase [Vallitalea pronyensis]|uniref:Sulfatase n=1 Tax=Vallitalea pronyensis TaxID=1348613 RepID=A0A8J8MIF0_9FIRM|nr:sulfatase [Vallitalea pronyensis]QUI22235.1 sulfatase [Vallitalea pronyensis]
MKKKNILYIFADQWRKKGMGFEGEPVATPAMDKFASESMVFDHAISTYPLCSPHRGALMTGKYPYSLGLWTNCKIGLDEVVMLKPQEVSIANVLKKEGYATAYIGKWHLDGSEKNFQDTPESGADNWDAYTPKGERRQGFDYWCSYGAMNAHLDPHYWQDNNKKVKPKIWSPEFETNLALDYLENRDQDKPFCMFISWNPPHPPLDKVPDKYLKTIHQHQLMANVPDTLKNDPAYIKRVEQYYGAIAGLDHNFGRIMAYLKEHNLVENTIVVLSADHGEMLGAHGRTGKNIWYEESINIPFIIRGGGIKAGRTDVLFSSIDHMPTLLDLLGIDIPSTVHGRSFKHVLMHPSNRADKQQDTVEDEPKSIFLSMIPGLPELVEPYRERGLNNKAFGWRGLRTKTHTYVVDNGCHPEDKQVRYIYHLKDDPLQLNPEMVSQDDSRCMAYDHVLRGYLAKIKDPFLLNR